MYLVCFDLGANEQERLKQIAYWLDYLQSLIAPTSFASEEGRNIFLANWRVILVGLRFDLIDEKHANKSAESISASFSSCIAQWRQTWSALPLFDQVPVTSKLDAKSIEEVWKIVKHESSTIMNKFTTQIPVLYLSILDKLRESANGQPFVRTNDLGNLALYQNLPSTLRYLHAVGDIVLLQNGLICVNPASVSKMMAKFISPEQVQRSLPHIKEGKAVILTTEQAGRILELKEDDPNLLNELQTMSHFGICYQLPLSVSHNSKLSFMFPSLAEESKSMLMEL